MIVLFKNPPHFRVFWNYFIFKFSYFLRLRKLYHSPISLVIYANKVCNFKCDFCFTYGSLNNNESSKFELTLERMISILDTESGMKALRVGILGGEPFLNKNLFELVEELKRRRKITTIVTNCSLVIGDKLKKLQESRLDVLGMSLYDNNWADVERVACSMNQVGKMYWVQAVISIETIFNMENIILFCLKIGCKNLLFANYQPSYTGKKNLTILLDNHLYRAEEIRLKKLYANLISISWVPMVNVNPQKKSCTMPFSYLHVDALGGLGACCFRAPDEKKFGNVFDKKSWNLPYYQSLRDNMFSKGTKGMDECDLCENLECDLYKV